MSPAEQSLKMFMYNLNMSLKLQLIAKQDLQFRNNSMIAD